MGTGGNGVGGFEVWRLWVPAGGACVRIAARRYSTLAMIAPAEPSRM